RRRRQQSCCGAGDRPSSRRSSGQRDRVVTDGRRWWAMSLLAIIGAEDATQTPSKFWPEGYEMLFGIPASLIVFFLLWKFAGPTIKKGMASRTAKIQGERDAGQADRAAAAAEAAQIRQAKGDIAAERARMLADADTQAAALLEDGRARLAQEISELETRAAADLTAAAARSGDE